MLQRGVYQMNELTFQILNSGAEVSAKTFRDAVKHALYLLGEFDAGISQRSRGILNWYVRRIDTTESATEGALTISFVSHLKPLKKKYTAPPDIAPRVTRTFLSGVEDLEEHCRIPPYLSGVGMERAGEMADLLRKNGAKGFRFVSDDKAVEVTGKTSDNVGKLLSIRRTSIGSVEGRLEGINIHRNLRVILYHAVTKRAVSCLFDPLQLDLVKNALGKRVVVSGELKKNLNGDTVRIEHPQLEVLEGRNRFQLPDVGEIGKPDFEEAETTREYMELIRGAR
jgi:hypothetical protein